MWKTPLKDFEFSYNLTKHEQVLNLYIDESPKWNEYFKNIIVISKYDINSEELKNIRMIQSHKNIKIQKFDAIYPLKSHPKFNSVGYYGNALSHYNVIKMAKENNWENVMILEDDVVFHKYFNKYMNQIVSELETITWDLMYGFKDNPIQKSVEIIKELKNINQIKGILSAHCYIINNQKYDEVLKYFDGVFDENNNIGMYDYFLKNNNFIKFVPKINLCSPILRNKNVSGHQVPYMNEIICDNYKIILPKLHSPIIDTCNLSCENCSYCYGSCGKSLPHKQVKVDKIF